MKKKGLILVVALLTMAVVIINTVEAGDRYGYSDPYIEGYEDAQYGYPPSPRYQDPEYRHEYFHGYSKGRGHRDPYKDPYNPRRYRSGFQFPPPPPWLWR